MSIRPSYRKRSVVQVLADGMSAHPSTGRSCCEEAQLTANEAKAAHDNWMAAARRAEKAEAELARRNEELSEAEDEIAAQRKRSTNELNVVQRNLHEYTERAVKAEAKRDELRAKLDAAENRPTLDRDAVEAAVLSGSVSGGWDGATQRVVVGRVVDAVMQLAPPSENRPTLDRQKIADTLDHHFGTHSCSARSAALSDLMALAPAEGWPEWLGPKPWSERLENGWLRWNCYPFACQKGDEIMIGIPGDGLYEVNAGEAREFARCLVGAAEAAEQDATGDEDQRGVNDLAETIRQSISSIEVDDPDQANKIASDIIDAGWTPPENEAE